MSYLKDIAVFVRVVQLKGFAAAGRDLGLTAPSISKQIARLEAELGVALLHRTTHNLFLTDAGTQFFERCVDGLGRLEEARAAALSFNDELRGKLRVHATSSVGQALIAPALIDFMAAHDQIHIDLEMARRRSTRWSIRSTSPFAPNPRATPRARGTAAWAMSASAAACSAVSDRW